MLTRAWNAAVAVLVLFGLVLQVIIAIRVSGHPPSSATGSVRGASLVGRLIRVLSFFTVQSNILCGVVCAQLAQRRDRDGRGWRVLRLDAVLGITVTGIIYSTVLARVHEPNGAAETTTNTIFHYIVPVMVVLGWLAFGPRPRITGRIVLWSLSFPALWLAYTLVRGAIWHWYPYPFLDVVSHGYLRVLLNSVLVTVVLGAVGAVFAVADRQLPASSGGLTRGRD